MTGKHVEEGQSGQNHDIRGINSNKSEVQVQSEDVKKKHLENQFKPYLSIDLQESLSVTGNTLLICTP